MSNYVKGSADGSFFIFVSGSTLLSEYFMPTFVIVFFFSRTQICSWTRCQELARPTFLALLLQILIISRPSGSSIVRSSALVRPCFGTFPLCAHVPLFQISFYYSRVCFFLLLHPYCVGYPPRAWDPLSL